MRTLFLFILCAMTVITTSCGDPDPLDNEIQCDLLAENQSVEIGDSNYEEIFEANAEDPPTHILIHSAPSEVEICNENSDRACTEGVCEIGECLDGAFYARDRDAEFYCLVDCSEGLACAEGRECDSRGLCSRQRCTDDSDCAGSSTCSQEEFDICTAALPAATPPGGEICTEDQDCRSCFSAPLEDRISVGEPTRFFRSEPGTIQYSSFQCQEYS